MPFFSEKMSYCQCIVSRQLAWEAMNVLGRRQVVHFVNNTPHYDSPFYTNLKRCEEALLHIQEINQFVNGFHSSLQFQRPLSLQKLLEQFDNDVKMQHEENGRLYVNSVMEEADQIYRYLIGQKKELLSIHKELKQKYIECVLLITIRNSQHINSLLKDYPLGGQIAEVQSIFQISCLVIPALKQEILSKSLFRITKGNLILHRLQIPYQTLHQEWGLKCNELKEYIIMVIIYQRSEQGVLKRKINKLLSSFQHHQSAKILDMNKKEQELYGQNLKAKITELNNLQDLTLDSVQRYLHRLYEPRKASDVSQLLYLELYLLKEKEIYNRLACTQLSSNFIHFNIFISSQNLPLEVHFNEQLPPLITTVKDSQLQPPSKFECPQVMKLPQQILYTYGVPSYNQLNPSVFYLVTFSFFIGVMFGDVGHMLIALPLIWYFKPNIWVYSIVFFMGYCGLIYNEMFGLNIGIFSSCYIFSQAKATLGEGCVYPFGIDSVWRIASNGMSFTNSLKMKLSVIIGVAHMLLGLAVKVINNLKNRQFSTLFLVTIPQWIFMTCTFVYMDFLIVVKWLTFYSKDQNPPSIIQKMISSYTKLNQQPTTPLWKGDNDLQHVLKITIIATVFLMLLGKPLLMCWRNRNNPSDKSQPVMQFENMEIDLQGPNKPLSNQHNASEVFVHQFIETIEYVLGSISNTASYLRLWALSLAHTQLSSVIFQLILMGFIMGGYSSIVGVLIGFPFYLAVTFGVLICMDSMECFLHSLRLHWVQFQNKFYDGKGYLFTPFTFKSILKNKLRDSQSLYPQKKL